MEGSVLEKTSRLMEVAFRKLSSEFATKIPREWLNNMPVDYFGSPTPLRQLAALTISSGSEIQIHPYDKDLSDSIIALLEERGLPVRFEGSIKVNYAGFDFSRSKFAVTAATQCREQLNSFYTTALADLRNDPERDLAAESQLHKLLEAYQQKINRLENRDDENGDFLGSRVPRPVQPPEGERNSKLPLPTDED